MARETKLPNLVQLRLSDDLARQIDDFRRQQADIPTRSEAIRRLVERGLTVTGPARANMDDLKKQ